MKKRIVLFAVAIVIFGSIEVMAQTSESVKKGTSEVKKTPDQEGKVVKLKITGMTCAGCANHLYKVLSETPGVINNEVKYPWDITVVKYDASKINPEEIIKSIEEKTRYTAELSQEKDKKKDKI